MPDAQRAARAVRVQDGDDRVRGGQTAGVAVERRIAGGCGNVLRDDNQHLPRIAVQREELIAFHQKRLRKRIVHAEQIAACVESHIGRDGVAVIALGGHGDALEARQGILIQQKVRCA